MANKKKIEKTKKVKLNDKVNKRAKKVSNLSDEAREIRNFIIILLGIIIVVLAVYGISKIFTKEKVDTTDEDVAGQINYDIVSVGTMLSKPDKEYYVVAYDENDTQTVLYSSIISNYLSKEKSLNVYFCNLANKLNSDYYVGKGGVSNPKAKKIEDLALGDLTLIKVKNGKIVKYLETLDTIKNEFGV